MPTGEICYRAPSMGQTAKIILDGVEHELPVIVGSEGEHGIDIRKLRATTGHVTLDSGYMNTGSCQSAITAGQALDD